MGSAQQSKRNVNCAPLLGLLNIYLSIGSQVVIIGHLLKNELITTLENISANLRQEKVRNGLNEPNAHTNPDPSPMFAG